MAIFFCKQANDVEVFETHYNMKSSLVQVVAL